MALNIIICILMYMNGLFIGYYLGRMKEERERK